jgi:hypothetical protein
MLTVARSGRSKATESAVTIVMLPLESPAKRVYAAVWGPVPSMTIVAAAGMK